MKWLDMKSPVFLTLFKFFTDTRLCNTVKKCCNFLHTGGLEVYHNVGLKVLPKRSSYSLIRMIIGSMLVAIEVNSNLETNLLIKRKTYWKYSRSQKQYVAKQRIVKKDFSFRADIMQEMMSIVKTTGLDVTHIPILDLLKGYYLKRGIPKRMVDIEYPTGDPSAKSRF